MNILFSQSLSEVFKKHLSNICKIKVANNWIQTKQILGEFKSSKIAPRKIVAKKCRQHIISAAR
jgi:hypothetical protein